MPHEFHVVDNGLSRIPFPFSIPIRLPILMGNQPLFGLIQQGRGDMVQLFTFQSDFPPFSIQLFIPNGFYGLARGWEGRQILVDGVFHRFPLARLIPFREKPSAHLFLFRLS